jgi:NADH:ubiquinone oxidoreductase subunit E
VSAGPGAVHGADAEHVPVFTGPVREKLDALFPKFPTKQAACCPALWIIQEERGWISPGPWRK